jgi:hypothetical protein
LAGVATAALAATAFVDAMTGAPFRWFIACCS